MTRRLTWLAVCLWALTAGCSLAWLWLPLRDVAVLAFALGVFWLGAAFLGFPVFSSRGGGSPSGPSPVRDGRVSPGPTVAPSQAVADTRSPLPGVGEDGARTVPPTGR